LLAGISSASIQGRIALGPRAGRRGWRMGEEPDAPWVLSSHPRHAHIAGFDLHANVAVPAADRARLEQLCRYLLRPPVAQDRLRRMGDDHLLLTLKSPWADGPRHLMFAPMELLEKLAALTPRPRINLILYHGVLAPHARWRARVVAFGALPGTTSTTPNLEGDSDNDRALPSPPRHWAWANLMRRAFDLDVLACPRCGGRLRLLGTIEDPVAIRAILDHLGGGARDEPALAPAHRGAPIAAFMSPTPLCAECFSHTRDSFITSNVVRIHWCQRLASPLGPTQ
jgi:hypothetical protein